MAIVSGLLEIILYVKDMQKQVHFYRDFWVCRCANWPGKPTLATISGLNSRREPVPWPYTAGVKAGLARRPAACLPGGRRGARPVGAGRKRYQDGPVPPCRPWRKSLRRY